MKPAGRRHVIRPGQLICRIIFSGTVSLRRNRRHEIPGSNMTYCVPNSTQKMRCLASLFFIRNKHYMRFSVAETLCFRAKFKAPLYSGFTSGLLGSSCLSARPSVHIYQCGSHWTISVESDTEEFYENLSTNSKFC